jgi:alpha,alpha-trehalose phosphorylase
MISHASFGVDPWSVQERQLKLGILAQTESIFALSNGHIGVRGNLDEGEPFGLPGTYLNSFHELRPLPYAERAYGYAESGQTIVNVTNGKLIRLLVDDEPFDVRYGRLLEHTRVLDLRAGVLRRDVLWESPAGKKVRIRSVRLVSFVHRAIMAISYAVEPVDDPVRAVVQSELVANEDGAPPSSDPRAAAALGSPLVLEENVVGDSSAVLVHHTRESGLRLAAAMDHAIDGPGGVHVESSGAGDVARVTVTADVRPGAPLHLAKFVAYGWSSERSRPAVHDQVVAALASARLAGWDRLLADQRAFLDDFWSGADVELDGDAEIQQAVRFGIFHVLQAGVRAERRPIPAKGLTGPGYDGHTFWDTETYVLPLLTYTRPEAAADALCWRHAALPSAEARARDLGWEGAAFPWRTITGPECSGYWPAGTAAVHVNADIADAALRYVDATGDDEFERETALPLLVATARLWRSIGHHDAAGRFRIDGVTGPDEYSAIADNNVYTNLMAEQNLRRAAACAARHADMAETLGVSEEEMASWRDAAAALVIPFDDRLGVHPQAEGFTDHDRWDFEATASDQYPLMLHFPYFDLYRKQVVKQADLVLAMHLRGDAFTPEQKAANFAYYDAITVRDSSLSASTQAVLAAEIGHLDLAHAYLAEAALLDLYDSHDNTRDGLHLASLAGAWNALVAGFIGMRATSDRLSFAPRLPSAISRIAFSLRYRGRRLRVAAGAEEVTYELLDGEPVRIGHHGEDLTLGADPIRRKIPPAPVAPPVHQPAGRAPTPRFPAGTPAPCAAASSPGLLEWRR